MHVLCLLQTADALYEKRKKKEAPVGWESFNQRTLYRAYEKRTANVDVDLQVCLENLCCPQPLWCSRSMHAWGRLDRSL